MPIDRIGKGGGVPPQAPGATEPSGAAPTKPFEVEGARSHPASGGPAATDKAAAAAEVGASALDQLRAGKIDVNRYVEIKLDEATKHLRGLHASELEHVREALRDKIVQDPQLVDLVRHATGQVPKPQDE
jgi:hypothetical protein